MRALLLVVIAACGRIDFERVAPPLGDGSIPNPRACTPIPHAGSTIAVATTAELRTAVETAAPGTEIQLESGRYLVDEKITFRTAGLILRARSGKASDVILEAAPSLEVLLYVRASNVVITELTVVGVPGEGIQVEADDLAQVDISGVVIHDVTLLDNLTGFRVRAFESFPNGPYADNGRFSCSRVAATSPSSPACTGSAIRGNGARDWVVRNNLLDRSACTAPGERLLWFTEGSRDTVIVDNRLVAGNLNIMLGGNQGRTYQDPLPAQCAGIPMHLGGVVCNNVIDGLDVPVTAGDLDFGEGIALWGACESWALHNTVSSPDVAETFSAIEYRFPGTFVHLENNLSRIAPAGREGGAEDTAVAPTNLTYPDSNVFVDAAAGDLHLAANAPALVGARNDMFEACARDADGVPRSATPTVGAYER